MFSDNIWAMTAANKFSVLNFSSSLFFIYEFLFLFSTEMTGHKMVRNSKFRWENGKNIIFHHKHGNTGPTKWMLGESKTNREIYVRQMKWRKNSFAFCNVKCFRFIIFCFVFGCHRTVSTDNIKQLEKEPSFRYDMQIFVSTLSVELYMRSDNRLSVRIKLWIKLIRKDCGEFIDFIRWIVGHSVDSTQQATNNNNNNQKNYYQSIFNWSLKVETICKCKLPTAKRANQ